MVKYRNPNTQTSLKHMVLHDLQKTTKTDRTENEVKVYHRYIADISRTAKGDTAVVLEAATKLLPNLQLTIEELGRNGNVAFLDLIVNVDSRKKITCGCYQKPTDTGTNFRGCAFLQYKLLKGGYIGFSEVPQNGKFLTWLW